MRPFKLQTVLDYRKTRADRMEKELQEYLECQRAFEAIKEEEEIAMLQLCEELEKTKQQSVNILEIAYCQDCICFKKRYLLELEDKLRAANAVVKQKKRELVRARQEKRVLEILKEKKEEAVRSKQKHREMSAMDEVAILRFGGKNELA